jgi:membrane protease YdiL (CAAX protease family)
MKRKLFYFLGLLLISIVFMILITREISSHYQLSDTSTFILSAISKLVLLFILYRFALKKVTFFDVNKVLKNNTGVWIAVGILLFLSLRFSLPYIGIRYTWEHLMVYYVKYFCVGVTEEVVFRWLIFGLLVAAYPQRGILKQMVIASAIFASFHIGNLIHMDIFSVLNQMALAFGAGLFFQGLLVRYRNIALISVLHGLVDFHGAYHSTFGLENSAVEESSNLVMDMLQTQLIFWISVLVLLLILRWTMKNEDPKRLYAYT